MSKTQDVFIRGIKASKKVRITYNCKRHGQLEIRTAAPYELGPKLDRSGKVLNQKEVFQFKDLDRDHYTAVAPEHVEKVELLEETFDPKQIVIWPGPYKWTVPRDWKLSS